MPRIIKMKVQDIFKRRGEHWEQHYRNRGVAKMYAREDADHIAYILARDVPAPEMLIDGALLDSMAIMRAMYQARERLGFQNSDRSMMCVWYWSEPAWMEFVRLFQALPDPIEDYYLFYDEQADGMRLLPVSEKGKNRPKSQGELRGNPPTCT